MSDLNNDRYSLILNDQTDQKDHFALRIFEGQNFITMETLVNNERQDVIVSAIQLLELEFFIKKHKSLCQK